MSFGDFPFPSFSPPAAGNASRWAANDPSGNSNIVKASSTESEATHEHMNSFITVFFVIPPHYDPPAPLVWALIGSMPLIMGVILLLVWLNKSRRAAKIGSGERNNYQDLLATGILIVVGVCMTFNFAGSYFVQRNTASQLAHLYATQQYQVVEGTVHVLRLQPKGGHAPGDLIVIGNKQLEIDYYVETIGYKQTIANGGALTEGTYARVYFVDDTIIRIEVKLPATPSNP